MEQESGIRTITSATNGGGAETNDLKETGTGSTIPTMPEIRANAEPGKTVLLDAIMRNDAGAITFIGNLIPNEILISLLTDSFDRRMYNHNVLHMISYRSIEVATAVVDLVCKCPEDFQRWLSSESVSTLGLTAFHVAAFIGREDVYKLLLERFGAITVSKQPQNIKSPLGNALSIAAGRGFADMAIELFRDGKGDMRSSGPGFITVWDRANLASNDDFLRNAGMATYGVADVYELNNIILGDEYDIRNGYLSYVQRVLSSISKDNLMASLPLFLPLANSFFFINAGDDLDKLLKKAGCAFLNLSMYPWGIPLSNNCDTPGCWYGFEPYERRCVCCQCLQCTYCEYCAMVKSGEEFDGGEGVYVTGEACGKEHTWVKWEPKRVEFGWSKREPKERNMRFKGGEWMSTQEFLKAMKTLIEAVIRTPYTVMVDNGMVDNRMELDGGGAAIATAADAWEDQENAGDNEENAAGEAARNKENNTMQGIEMELDHQVIYDRVKMATNDFENVEM